MSAPRMAEHVGRVLGERYRLVAPIGAGASARVFLADDTTLGRQVAVKLLHEALAEDQAFLDRFAREARMAAALQHAHIVAVHDWGYDHGEPFIVTEFCSGGSLRSMLDRRILLTASQALLVGLEASRALEHAHRRGVVHRDIKPSNLLFDGDGRLRVADFGLARALAEASTTEPTGAVLGTARYASPEQARGQAVDGRGDVYALALVLVEAVTGRVPFEADTTIGTLMARVEQPLMPPDELGALVRPLARAGAVEAADRSDAGDLSVMLMATAERLPRPEPIPVVGALSAASTTVTEPTEHGRPATPTGPTDPAGPAEAAEATETVEAADIVSTGSAFTHETARSVPPEVAEPGPAPEPAFTRREQRRLEREKARALAEQQTAVRAAWEPEAPATTRRRWPWVIVALMVIGGIGAAIWFARETSEVTTVAMPDLVGDDLDAASEVADANGWELRIFELRPGGVPVNQIIRQEPDVGVELVEGDEITVTISIGEPLVTVPPGLVGLAVDDVALRLSAVGLALGEQTERFDETAPAGEVLDVSSVVPELPAGSEVDVVVSIGPAPRAVPDDVVGLELAEARDLVESARFAVVVERTYDEEVPADVVISVDPPEGTELEVDSVVTLSVSRGPEPVEVPDLEGLDVLTAAEMLEDAGLCVGETDGPANNEIIATDPPAGEVVDVDTCVRIITRETEEPAEG